MLPPLRSEPQAPDFQVLQLLNSQCAGSLNSLDPYVVMNFFGINRARLHKDLKS